MRHLFLSCIIMLLLPASAFSQLSGTGASGNPFTGSLNSDIVWPPAGFQGDTVYANDILIPSGYELTVSPDPFTGIHVEFTGLSRLTIAQGSSFILNPKGSVTVREIINNGVLRMESFPAEPGLASLLHSEYSGTGTSEVRFYLRGGQTAGDEFRWHYISVPVSGVNVSLFNTLNLAQYVESLVNGPDNYVGWVAWDGYHYSTGAPSPGNSFQTLTLGRGYNFYSDYSNNVITLTGVINIDDISLPITCGSGYPDYQGYNLLGNPFSSCLDWDELVTLNPSADYYNAIYFTNEGSIASYVGGIGAHGGSGTIPPMQGFFIKASGNFDFSLAAEARVHNNDQFRYKKKSTSQIHTAIDTIAFIRLKINSSVDSTDLVVRFNNNATEGADKLYDAFVFGKQAGNVNIWTTAQGIAYSINGLPFPEATLELPVDINANVAGTYTFSLSGINRMGNYSIHLKDLVTGRTADLTNGETLEFQTGKALTEGRFILAFTQNSTVIEEDLIDTENLFKVFFSDGMLNLVSLSESVQNQPVSVRVYDMTGRIIHSEAGLTWTGNRDIKIIQVDALIKGLYYVEILGGLFRTVWKIPML